MHSEDIRDVKTSLRRGGYGRCPRCGEGKIFGGYLKVAHTCAVCGLDLSLQRADDGPAYLTILIVGHLMIPALHIAYRFEDPNPAVVALVLSVLSVAGSLALLPRIKGAMIGLQWAKRMHGF